MILTDIRKYIKQQGRASLDDLIARFDGDKTAIEGIMETLKERGVVLELGCGSCGRSTGCSLKGPRIYAHNASGAAKKQKSGLGICNSQAG